MCLAGTKKKEKRSKKKFNEALNLCQFFYSKLLFDHIACFGGHADGWMGKRIAYLEAVHILSLCSEKTGKGIRDMIL